MAISLTSIHGALNDFILSTFGSDAGSKVIFRFDKFGSAISDADFVDPNHPGNGYVPALAVERFSDLVNRVPVDDNDGLNIVLSEDSVDETYFFRLLSPSVPNLPKETDDATRQAIVSAFSTTKAAALKLWETQSLESSTGLMLQFKPALAIPRDWYDTTKSEVWTNHHVEISKPPEQADDPPDAGLWKLAPSDELLAQVLQPEPVPVDERPPNRDLLQRVQELRVDPSLLMVRQEISPVLLRSPARVALAANETVRIGIPVVPERIAAVAVADGALLARDDLRSTFVQEVTSLNVRDRLVVNRFVAESVTTEPVKTDSITVSFDYCLIRIDRPWYVDAFINAGNWYIPTVAKGQVTAADSAGGMPLLPIGLVVIRNLDIRAQWTNDDATNAAQATDLGPFKVQPGLTVQGSLTHPGIQAIGWLLQQLPSLPPQDPA